MSGAGLKKWRPIRERRRVGDGRHGEGGGVGRQQGLVRRGAVERAEDRLLYGQVLDGRLDDHVGRLGHVDQIGHRGQPRGGGLVSSGVELALGHHAPQPGFEARSAGVGSLRRDVVEAHLVTGQETDLRDAGAHRAGADDPDLHSPVNRGERFSLNAATPSA
jgi:hypothetical protein